MSKIIPRAYPRTACHVPIRYALLNTEQFQTARTCDYSTGGLCYETGQELERDTEVCIVMDNYTPHSSGLEKYRSYLARIRWIHPIRDNGAPRFAAGAQLMVHSHEVMATEAQLPHCDCALCGRLKPAHHLDTTPSGAQVCAQCCTHFKSIPSEKIRQCVERFMLGNVV